MRSANSVDCSICGVSFFPVAYRPSSRLCGIKCHGENVRRQAAAKRDFWSKVAVGSDSECWPWLGARKENGYGVFSLGGSKRQYAHRHAYAISHGKIADGMVIAHSCDNPPCCNPHHLREATDQENVNDMVTRQRVQRKLQIADVLYIRNKEHGLKQKDLADKFGITQAAVSAIQSRKNWTWLPPA